MSNEINYENNPLNGLGLKQLLTELIDHYGFEILFAYLNINCFKTNPSLESSIKFLKKTEWAREKVEVFYMYEFKNLPKASFDQFALPPRDRIVPDGQVAGEPAELDLDDAQRLREKRAKKAAERGQGGQGGQRGRDSYKRGGDSYTSRERETESPYEEGQAEDPWAKWRDKS